MVKKQRGDEKRSDRAGLLDNVSRRSFLAAAGSAGLGLAATGCGGSSVSPLDIYALKGLLCIRAHSCLRL